MKKKKFIFISVVFLIIVSSFCLLEIYFKKNDFLNIFNGKIVVLNLLKGFIPDNEKIIIDDFEIRKLKDYDGVVESERIFMEKLFTKKGFDTITCPLAASLILLILAII